MNVVCVDCGNVSLANQAAASSSALLWTQNQLLGSMKSVELLDFLWNY